MAINYNDMLQINGANTKYIKPKYYGLISEIMICLHDLDYPIDKIEKIGDLLSEDKESLFYIIKILIRCGFDSNFKFRYYLNWLKTNKYVDKTDFNSKTIGIKYKFIDGVLFLYDYLLSRENVNYLKITKINDIDINEIIEKFRNKGFQDDEIEYLLFHKELLEAIGVNCENYKLTIINDDEEITLPLSDEKFRPTFSIFEKKHKRATILDEKNFSISRDYQETIPDKKLSYAYDSGMKLLMILHGLSKSKNDIQLFEKIYNQEGELFFFNEISDKYLDWMYISSFLLLYEKEIPNLPDYLYQELETFIKSNLNYHIDLENLNFIEEPFIILLDEFNNSISIPNEIKENGYGCNSYIFNQSKYDLDYKKMFKAIRNSLAHSSYEVINEDYIRVYGVDKNNNINFNIKVKKELILNFIQKISDYSSFGNLYPICTLKKPNYNNVPINNKSELIAYLKQIQITDINIKKYYDIDKSKDEEYKFQNAIHYLKSLIKWHPIVRRREDIKFETNRILKNYMDYELLEYELTEEQINNIVNNIENFKDVFYGHSATNQHKIISELVSREINNKKCTANILVDILKNNQKTSGKILETLDENPTKYIDYFKVIEATILAYLNNILLYSYNENYHIDYSEMNLASSFNIEYIDRDFESYVSGLAIAKNQFLQQISNIDKKVKNRQQAIDGNKKRIISGHYKNEEELVKIEQKISELEKQNKPETIEENKLKAQLEYEKLQTSINITAKNNFNSNIICHLRNSLAHGRIKIIGSIDINDIANTTLEFTDIDETNNCITFKGNIKLIDLLIQLSNEKFIRSIYVNEEVKKKK